jgi:hypothetical protein
MSEFIGIKGARMDHDDLVGIVNRQVATFSHIIEHGSKINFDPRHAQEVIRIYEMMRKKSYSRKAIVERLIALPCSIGGNYVIPSNEMVVEVGIGYTHKDYTNLFEGGDEPTIWEIEVCRPKKTKGLWIEFLPYMIKTMKDEKEILLQIDEDLQIAAMSYLEEHFDIFPGGYITCPGWREGIEGIAHSCGSIVLRKEMYHGYMCDSCLTASKNWRAKGRGKAGANKMVRASILRKKLRVD